MSYKGLFSAIECNRIVIIEDDFKQGEYKKERALYDITRMAVDDRCRYLAEIESISQPLHEVLSKFLSLFDECFDEIGVWDDSIPYGDISCAFGLVESVNPELKVLLEEQYSRFEGEAVQKIYELGAKYGIGVNHPAYFDDLYNNYILSENRAQSLRIYTDFSADTQSLFSDDIGQAAPEHAVVCIIPERMANIKFIAVSRSLSGILDYVTNREKTVERLISGVNCVAQTAQAEFEAVKKQFRKTDGRSYYHIVQAFAPDDPLDFDTAHEIGLKFAEYFKGYQCVVVTHMNTAHIHNHIIMNSVNFETGQKFHQSAREMQQAKEYSNQLCREYGLSFTESKADPFRIPAWKKRLCRTIKEAMENCATREEFIAFMAEYGYKVRWEANQKYITYTTPENVRCRDNKLFDQTLLRSSMEAYFDMGGCEYLESRIDATEYGELLPTVDDAVCGLISILDAMNTGDNDRFHLETLHHSKQEIRRILERGGKIDRTVEYAVDDEDEEYEQYHGFSMRM